MLARERSVYGNLNYGCEEVIASAHFTMCVCRLLVTEGAGAICRDDSVEGLRFYPNKFLETEA